MLESIFVCSLGEPTLKQLPQFLSLTGCRNKYAVKVR